MRPLLILLVVSLLAGCGSSMTTSKPSASVVSQDVALEVVTLPEIGIELVHIPGGEFMMGTTDRNFGESPEHRVRLDGFYIAKTEVTQAQWERVRASNPSEHKGCPDCPVENVSWIDVNEFLISASRLKGVTLRLPTEAEWEYAAKGGATHQSWAGTDRSEDVGKYAWYFRNSGGVPHPVGEKEPNFYGLHDMSGNVWEWCGDRHALDYYSRAPADNPKGPEVGDGFYVIRGGAYHNRKEDLEVAYRMSFQPFLGNGNIGFRIVMDAAKVKSP